MRRRALQAECNDCARLGDVTVTSTKRFSSLFQSSPLRHSPFRLFYFGSIGTALGYTMQATVAAWLMATLTPSPLMVALVQLPDLAIAVEPLPDDGPVLIQLEFRIDPEHREAFLRAIHASEPTRRRNGAISWRVFRDLGEEGRFVERFIIASWAEFVRLRTRMTMADRKLQERVEQFQRPGVPIRISRLIGVQQ